MKIELRMKRDKDFCKKFKRVVCKLKKFTIITARRKQEILW